jgi:hypothetical protein
MVIPFNHRKRSALAEKIAGCRRLGITVLQIALLVQYLLSDPISVRVKP